MHLGDLATEEGTEFAVGPVAICFADGVLVLFDFRIEGCQFGFFGFSVGHEF
jgi:hypothetical protein